MAVLYSKPHLQHMRKLLCLLLLLLFTFAAHAQQEALQQFNTKQSEILKFGMLGLGLWALLNILTGSLSLTKATRSKRYFHQMNLYWNIVNICIAGASLYFILSDDATRSMAQSLSLHHWFKKILYLNVGLDVSYILLGALLKEHSRNSPKTEQFTGWGNAIVLQGLFLLLLDLVLTAFLEKLTGQLMQLVPAL